MKMLTVKLEPKTFKALDRLAERHRLSRSVVVRQLLGYCEVCYPSILEMLRKSWEPEKPVVLEGHIPLGPVVTEENYDEMLQGCKSIMGVLFEAVEKHRPELEMVGLLRKEGG